MIFRTYLRNCLEIAAVVVLVIMHPQETALLLHYVDSVICFENFLLSLVPVGKPKMKGFANMFAVIKHICTYHSIDSQTLLPTKLDVLSAHETLFKAKMLNVTVYERVFNLF